MSKTEIAVAVLLVVMVAAVLYVQRPPGEPESLPLAEAPAPPETVEAPPIRYPVEPQVPPEQDEADAASAHNGDAAGEAAADGEAGEVADTGESGAGDQAAAHPLPPLDESDAVLKSELSSWFDSPSFARMFYVDRLVRRLVVMVDNLPGAKYPRSNYRVARPVPGQLVVRRVRIYEGDDEKLYLNPDNYARYNPFVEFFSGLDSERLVALYRRYYPLFQTAYEELGYPSAYFNDRLVDVIDHLLAAPEVSGEIKLVRPHVLYQYADPELEALSAGQKVLIRVGPQNAARLKSKLQELRGLLTGADAPVDEPVPETGNDSGAESPKV